MLITKQEILTIAYISTTITVDDTLDSAITTAELTYARQAMSASLFEDVSANPSDSKYAILLSDYLKPFLAFAVKAILFYQQMYESGASPSADDRVVFSEIYVTAKSKYGLLQNYCSTQDFTSYTAPAYKLKSGFLIKNKTS
jgi:hypothetical protein